MQLARPVFALNPKLFGKGRPRALEPLPSQSHGISADLKLFATTFLAGFVFISILIG
jgi:hypothetical protein